MKKIDSILQKAELFEKLAVYSDRGAFLRAIAQNVPDQIAKETIIDDVVPQQISKETTILSPIDPKTQNMLNELLVPLGKILPLKLDGELGDKTRAAIKEFEKLYGRATLSNITNVYNSEVKSKTPTKYDPSELLKANAPNSAGRETYVPGPK